MATKLTDLTWLRDNDPLADDEYNVERARLGDRGIVLVVFSDRDGTDWSYRLEADDDVWPSRGGFDTKEEAQEEALAHALGWLRRSADD